jgi:hypothetical protein
MKDSELSKVEMTLDDAFAQDFCARGGRVLPASAKAWAELQGKLGDDARKGLAKVIGIDVEGINMRPPVMVQVAAAGIVILEVPSPAHGLRFPAPASFSFARVRADVHASSVQARGGLCLLARCTALACKHCKNYSGHLHSQGNLQTVSIPRNSVLQTVSIPRNSVIESMKKNSLGITHGTCMRASL